MHFKAVFIYSPFLSFAEIPFTLFAIILYCSSEICDNFSFISDSLSTANPKLFSTINEANAASFHIITGIPDAKYSDV